MFENFDRAVILGNYIVSTGATVRKTAKEFRISKSTVHKDVTERLKTINPELYKKVKKVLFSCPILFKTLVESADKHISIISMLECEV